MSPEQVVSLGCTNVLCSELPMEESRGQQRGKQYSVVLRGSSPPPLSKGIKGEVETQGASDWVLFLLCKR